MPKTTPEDSMETFQRPTDVNSLSLDNPNYSFIDLLSQNPTEMKTKTSNAKLPQQDPCAIEQNVSYSLIEQQQHATEKHISTKSVVSLNYI